jgi:hypothetical protein
MLHEDSECLLKIEKIILTFFLKLNLFVNSTVQVEIQDDSTLKAEPFTSYYAAWRGEVSLMVVCCWLLGIQGLRG